MLDITLYIPCYNAAPYLNRVLPAVMAQTYPIREILIIDDGSTDDTAAIAERHDQDGTYPLRVIRQPENMGLAVGRNTAIRETKTEFIASLDSDVMPEPDWLERLAAEMVDGVSGVGGELLELFQDTVPDRWRAVHMVQHRGKQKMYRPPFLWGCNTLFRKSVLVGAGMYPEHCRTNAEDVKLCEAIRDEHILIYTHLARCKHLRRDTMASLRRNYWKWYYYGCYEDLEFGKTLASNKRNFKRFFSQMTRDVGRMDLPMALVTLSMLPYSCAMDWKDFFNNRTQARQPTQRLQRP